MGIVISEPAVSELHRLMSVENKENYGLRLGVKGGGCSGLSYIMQFEERSADHDKIQNIDGIQVFVDPKSYLYLNGLSLDYTTELIGGGFKFLNPGSKACSCGTSFSI